jgi:hypothetical protein
MTRNKQDKEQRQKEYRELLIELYKENQKFFTNKNLSSRRQFYEYTKNSTG